MKRILRNNTFLRRKGYKCILLIGVLSLLGTTLLFSKKGRRGHGPTITLEKADALSFDKDLNPDCQILSGNVVFRHDKAKMYCDSAFFNQTNNSFDAYGHVIMKQGDSLHVYGNILHYDGETKMARLKGNVKMIDHQTTLETDSFDYDRNQNLGYYYTGGKLYDKKNTLTSQWGEYSPKTKLAKFKQNVRLLNPDYSIGSGELQYSTKSKTAFLVGPSVILYKEKTTVYSEDGYYDTRIGQAELKKNSYIEQKDGQKLIADNIFYNKTKGEGNARGHVQLYAKKDSISLFGDYGYFRDKDKFGLVSGHALAKKYDATNDTLFLHADTLKTQNPDSLHHLIWGIGSVRFFKSDLQGKCDTLTYSSADSILNLRESPVVWSDSLQLSGEFMQIFQSNNKPKMIWVQGWAAGAMQDDSTRFNQMGGKSLKAYMKDGQLDKIVVEGNAETIYYPRDADDSIVGINRAASSLLTVYVKDKKLVKIVMSPASSGTLYPENQMPEDQKELKDFSWQDKVRPKDKNDVFTQYPLDKSKVRRHRKKNKS